EFSAPLWRWEARREFWTFVSLPAEVTDEIRDLASDVPRGFGAVRAHARVGAHQWWTSVFPQSAEGQYVLPIKKSVRTANGLDLGDPVPVWVQLHP
ncbi:DUF1905 domain-containing protein, partial [Amnibacterium sp.]|uniref:DUF1905 domain-containing protein n=1 Tax=Amnibacterium sp. TaxID=1872496 RepID=UPI003F7B640C